MTELEPKPVEALVGKRILQFQIRRLLSVCPGEKFNVLYSPKIEVPLTHLQMDLKGISCKWPLKTADNLVLPMYCKCSTMYYIFSKVAIQCFFYGFIFICNLLLKRGLGIANSKLELQNSHVLCSAVNDHVRQQ